MSARLSSGATVARIWRTRIDLTRVREYERFVDERSRPMFEAQDGFCGAIFGRDGDRCAVITLWRDAQAVEALAASPSYRHTVRALEATGLLRGEASIEVFRLHEAGTRGRDASA